MSVITCAGCGKSERKKPRDLPRDWLVTSRAFFDGKGTLKYQRTKMQSWCPECAEKINDRTRRFVGKIQSAPAHSVTGLPQGISMADVNEALDRAGMGKE